VLSKHLKDHLDLFSALAPLQQPLAAAAEMLRTALAAGRKVLICGNGGSAADALHFAAELTGRFRRERSALSAVALTADPSTLTALANDFGFTFVFSRQVEALGTAGDVLIGLSTSGRSANVNQALKTAGAMHLATIAMTGRSGAAHIAAADLVLAVPGDKTARIQEAHLFLLHVLADILDQAFADESKGS